MVWVSFLYSIHFSLLEVGSIYESETMMVASSGRDYIVLALNMSSYASCVISDRLVSLSNGAGDERRSNKNHIRFRCLKFVQYLIKWRLRRTNKIYVLEYALANILQILWTNYFLIRQIWSRVVQYRINIFCWILGSRFWCRIQKDDLDCTQEFTFDPSLGQWGFGNRIP